MENENENEKKDRNQSIPWIYKLLICDYVSNVD